jgi:tetratricopeptide (TPR) repeat protein
MRTVTGQVAFRRTDIARLLSIALAIGLLGFGAKQIVSAWQRNVSLMQLMSDSPIQIVEGNLALAVHNGDRRAQFWLCYLYAFQGQPNEVQHVCPDSKEVAYWLVLQGRNLYDTDPYRSIALFRQAIAVAPDYSGAYFFGGQSYQRLQNYEQAIAWYTHALEAGNFDSRLTSESGATHHRAGYAGIERTYQRLAESYIALRDWESAKKAVERLLEMRPGLADGYYLKGQIDYFRVVYNQVDNPDSNLRAAEESFRAAINREPRHFWVHVFLGRVYGQMGRLNDAQAEFEIAVSVDPSDPSGRLELGRTYLALGQVDEAVCHLEIAQKLAPSWPSVWVSLGDAYAAQWKIELASQAYREALQRDPTYEPAKHRLSGMEGR